MAPIPPEDPSLLLAGVSRRLNDIREFQLPRLRTSRGPADLHRELTEECRGDLERAWGNIQICRELAESQRPSYRNTTLGHCDSLEDDYRELKVEYRQALLESSRARKTAGQRHELLVPAAGGVAESNGESSKGNNRLKATAQVGLKDEDALQTKTNEVTDALRRTTQVMQAELERSVLSVQMLEESTRTLRSTTTLYDTYTGLLETSGRLVKALEKADFYDRLMIGAAFVFFLLCMFWIIKRRVLDKVVGGVGWWVMGSGKLIGMGLGLGRGGGRGVEDGGAVGKGVKTHGRLGPANLGRLGKPAADHGTKQRSGGGNQLDRAKHPPAPEMAQEEHEKELLEDIVPPQPGDGGSEIRSGQGGLNDPPPDDIRVKDEL